MLLIQEFEPFVRDICERLEVPGLTVKVVANAAPALRMHTLPLPSYGAIYNTSRFGGNPSLPEAVAWPQDDDGNDLDFILQIRLSEVAHMPQAQQLPNQGMMLLFADHRIQDDIQMLRGRHKLIYTLEEDAPVRERPFEYERTLADGKLYTMELYERPIRFSEVMTIYDAERLQERRGLEFSDKETEVYKENFDCATCDASMHLLFGLETHDETYPDIGDPENWSLFFRVDHDSDVNTQWFDGGRLHVFVRNEDLARGDFSRTVAACSSA